MLTPVYSKAIYKPIPHEKHQQKTVNQPPPHQSGPPLTLSFEERGYHLMTYEMAEIVYFLVSVFNWCKSGK